MKHALLAIALTPLTPLTLLHAAEPDTVSTAKVVDLRVESQTNPTTVNNPLPRFSWRIETEERAWLQKSYHILVASSSELLAQDKGDLWDSGVVPSRVSQFVQFRGTPLSSGQEAYWKIQVADSKSRSTPWTKTSKFVTELTGPEPLPESVYLKDAPRLSTFSSDKPRLNSLYEHAAKRLHEINGVRDIGLTLRAGAFHQPLHSRAAIWLDQLNDATDRAGFYPTSLPSDGTFGSTQSDAAIAAAHGLWFMTGDGLLYQRHIGKMKAYVLARSEADPEQKGTKFGVLPPDTLPSGDSTAPQFVHQVTQAINLRLILDMGRYCSSDPYDLFLVQKLQERFSESFQPQLFEQDGTVANHSVAALLLGLRSGLIESPSRKEAACTVLKQQVEKGGDPSELMGSPLISQSILGALTWLGEVDAALKIAEDLEPDKTSPVALAHVSEWLVSMLAGIDTDGPGFQNVRIQPHIPKDSSLNHAKAALRGPQGEIAFQWTRRDTGMDYRLKVPPNSIATVVLAVLDGQAVTVNGQDLASSSETLNHQRSDSTVVMKVGSGAYHFTIQ